MPNNYTPPPTINFYNSNFSSNLIYYNYQVSTLNLYGTSSASFSTIAAFTPNSIDIPIPGDYIITVTTGAYSSSGGQRTSYQWLITKSGQSNITVVDNAMALFHSDPNFAHNAVMSRKVTFPVSGVWTLTPQWKSSGGTQSVDTGDFYPWIVNVHAVNPLGVVNQQLTQFVNSSYTLMTNVDANAWWGNLTNATVAGYGTSITNHTNSIAAQTNSISSLTSDVTNLTTSVSNLQTALGGLTSVSVISGGIRIKP